MTTGFASGRQGATRSIVYVAYDGFSLLALSSFIEALIVLENDEVYLDTAPYKVTVVSPQGGNLKSYLGMSVHTTALADVSMDDIETLVIGGGYGWREAIKDRVLIDWIAQAARRARRLVSLATGVLLSAEAGALERGPVVTHWYLHDEFSRRYPHIEVRTDRLFLKQGNNWSSAGLSSTLDLVMHIVEEDLGWEASAKIAERLLVFVRRFGDDPQISPFWHLKSSDRLIEQLHTWILANLNKDLSVEVLAHQVGMSPRNFSRVYRSRTQATPAKAVEMLRVQASCRALRNSSERLSTISRKFGFVTESSFRRTFRRWMGVSPAEYREGGNAVLQEPMKVAPPWTPAQFGAPRVPRGGE